jgi:hypothetical protein
MLEDNGGGTPRAEPAGIDIGLMFGLTPAMDGGPVMEGEPMGIGGIPGIIIGGGGIPPGIMG